MKVEPKIFATVSMELALQIACMSKDIMFFNMMELSNIKDFYQYDGSKRLIITSEDLNKNVLNAKETSYNSLRLEDERRHYERIHNKFTSQDPYPVIPVYNNEKQSTEFVSPIDHYNHPVWTPYIGYTFNPVFISLNNTFKDGYRTVCVDVLNALVSKYARFFYVWLSGNLQEFHLSESKLRELLNITEKYKKRKSLLNILKTVQKQLSDIGIEFDYLYSNEAEWKAYKLEKDDKNYKRPAVHPAKNKKITKNFWFRAKGIDQYRIPKGKESIFSRDITRNTEYLVIRNFFNRHLKMSDKYIVEKWEYIIRYVNEYGAKQLMSFAGAKMKEMATQKSKPYNPKAVLMSLIVNKVKDLDKQGRGQSTPFSAPVADQKSNRYDPRGKTSEQILKDLENHLNSPPDTS